MLPERRRRQKDSFVFTEEMGLRLRKLRKKAGLTQDQVAVNMGRWGKSRASFVCRLEAGHVPAPTVRMLADYLRACRAKFADIADLLDAYTTQPTVPDKKASRKVAGMIAHLPGRVAKEVRNYDLATKPEPVPAGPSPEDVARRLKRAEKFARAALWRRKLHTHIVETINTRRLQPMDFGKETVLQAHARKLWGILNRTRVRKPELRKAELARAEEWLLDQGILKPEHVHVISRATIDFFAKAEESGDIDSLIVPGFGPGRRARAEDDRQRLLEEYDRARAELVERLWDETRPMLAAAGVTGRPLLLYRQLVTYCCHLVDYHEPGAADCREGINEYAANEKYRAMGLDPALARRVADAVMPRFDELRKSLPADPRGWTRPAK